jgi:hypothetical protein
MQKKMISLIAFVCVCGLAGCGGSAPRCKNAPDSWTPLLKGDTLAGWYTYLAGHGTNQDPDDVFTIHDGLLHIYKNAKNGSKMPFGYIATDQQYENYRLSLQFKWGKKRFAPRASLPRDSGLIYHFTGDDAIWPVSAEYQIKEGDTGSIYTVGTTVTTTIDPATGAYKEAADGGVTQDKGGSVITQVRMARDLEVPDWNDLEVIVRADTAVHIINGKVNNQCWNIRRPDPANPDQFIPVSKGRILLQAEGAEVYFRNVKIKPLD